MSQTVEEAAENPGFHGQVKHSNRKGGVDGTTACDLRNSLKMSAKKRIRTRRILGFDW